MASVPPPKSTGYVSPTIKQVWIHEKRPEKPEFSEPNPALLAQKLAHSIHAGAAPSQSSQHHQIPQSTVEQSNSVSHNAGSDSKESHLQAKVTSVVKDSEPHQKQLEVFQKAKPAAPSKTETVGRFKVTDM